MQVTRLEIFGFKSFMDRIVIPLEGGLTGVVGPNGCGKSNIVDALRWVLGETRASSLRGDKLEDVIFNGTEKLRPLGLAEVTVTMRAATGDFFTELGEQLQSYDVLSTLTEDGVSIDEEVTASQSPSTAEEPRTEGDRPRGVPELRVLEGGGVSVSPGGSDEPSGGEDPQTTDHGVETTPSPAPDPATSGFLARFSWLKGVPEVQVTRRLYRSGESEFFINRVPCRLRDIKEFFRALGLGARSHTIVAQGEVSRIVTAKPEERRVLLEEAAGVVGLKEKVAAARRRLEEASQNLTRLTDVIGEVSRQVASLKRQASQAEKRETLKSRIRELDTILFRDKLEELIRRRERVQEEGRRAEAEEQGKAAELARVSAEEDAARGSLMELDLQGDTLRNAIDGIREELATRARMRGERASRLGELRASVVARTNELKQLDERRAVLAERAKESKQEIEHLSVEEQRLAAELQTLEQRGDDDLRAAAGRLDSLRDSLRKQEHAVRQVREQVVSSESALAELKQQLVALSPLHHLQKTYGERGASLFGPQAASVRLLVDGLTVPQDLVRAVESVVAERAAFAIAQDPHQIGVSFVETVLAKHGGEGGFGVGVFQAASCSIEAHDRYGLSPLISRIQIAPEAQVAVLHCLRDVYVADNVREGSRFFAEAAAATDPNLERYRVVTRDGELFTSVSFFSFRHGGGVVQLKNKIDALRVGLDDYAERQRIEEHYRDLIQEQLAFAQQEHARILKETQERNARIRECSNTLASVRGRLHAGVRLGDQVESDARRVVEQSQVARVRLAEHEEEQARIRQEVENLSESQEQSQRARLAELQQEYATLDGSRKQRREALSTIASMVGGLRRSVEELRSRLASYALESQRTSLECESVEERFAHDYGVESAQEARTQIEAMLRNPPAEVTSQVTPEQRAEFLDEVQKLRARILREGDVDPSSIQRHQEEAARLAELEQQQRDLNSAAATIKETIERLTVTSQRRFIATFDAVRQQFERLVPRLFGGGKGTIELIDPSNPLDTGVEITLRPPGKKPKSMDLLSGGEKALTATALIVAMFLERPSPLCVLDEVDAPLDEANLIRFLQLVKEMSSRTQFMMITHNKQSMNLSDRLIGVTQQEPGASQVISVSLQEAYSQVA